jgi:hypothetical protein
MGITYLTTLTGEFVRIGWYAAPAPGTPRSPLVRRGPLIWPGHGSSSARHGPAAATAPRYGPPAVAGVAPGQYQLLSTGSGRLTTVIPSPFPLATVAGYAPCTALCAAGNGTDRG